MASGLSSEIAGGSFWDGVSISLAVVGARYLYNEIVQYDATWERGGAAMPKRRFDMPIGGANNIGVQGGPLDPNGLFNEGGRVSRFANHIPGINAVAGMHDVFQVVLDQWGGGFTRSFLNVPAMIPAAGITYSSLMAEHLATFHMIKRSVRY